MLCKINFKVNTPTYHYSYNRITLSKSKCTLYDSVLTGYLILNQDMCVHCQTNPLGSHCVTVSGFDLMSQLKIKYSLYI